MDELNLFTIECRERDVVSLAPRGRQRKTFGFLRTDALSLSHSLEERKYGDWCNSYKSEKLWLILPPKKKKGSKANNQMRRQRSPVDIDTS